jgi:MFS family permease
MLDQTATSVESARTREARKRWLALLVLCLGTVMIVLDSTIVNVALPSIRTALGFSETSLVWVVNAYMLTFGGFLLLSGRLGDLFGQRRIFLGGIVLFTLASLACGLSRSPTMLVAARAVQGIGGSAVSAISLSLIMNLFPEPGERAKAMGVYSFVCAGGGSVGVLLGGLLVQSLDWHWIFLVNIARWACAWWPFRWHLVAEGQDEGAPEALGHRRSPT